VRSMTRLVAYIWNYKLSSVIGVVTSNYCSIHCSRDMWGRLSDGGDFPPYRIMPVPPQVTPVLKAHGFSTANGFEVRVARFHELPEYSQVEGERRTF
jgi:hypothetical protein